MTRRQDETGLSPIEYQETQRAKILLEELRTNDLIAYRQRKEDWFKKHPEQQWFSPSLEETRRDTKLEEWIWYFVSRIFERTPEQKFKDEKHPSHGFGHYSNVHDPDEKCREGCRFWQDEGRIEDIEVLKDYEKYNGYEEVFNIWTAGQR